ncbi:uncharacterized protein LOC123313163 isoform X2 [Coccinella septempunctata]|uniref:uncharacterized protein LOC123313163 isoform X2 n=1 Tax=Coccinella septempunctata TaxID=41139 RepID=UPI001D069D82|nr:uncharacterized protein LOC123313163 isoform X2 [Coccinella septempunctata]
MDHKRETDEEIEANRVIEYYKKYCQNPDLIKYFTGPEASCVEKKVFNVDIHKKVPLRNPQPVILSENVDVQANQECVNEEQCNSSRTIKSPTSLDIVSEHEDTEEKNHSRSSSVASNKIEWDNGADIGYKNSYQFLSARKSASFPSLLTQNVSVNSRVLPKEAAEKSISENIQELRKMYHQLTFSSETSSSVNKGYTASSESKGQSSSSPQENKNMKISTKSSSSSDSYLHRKIGHPVAYSTPHEESTSKESIPGSSKDVKSSEKHFSESSRESTSKSSTKPGVYSVTPMLTLSAKPKRNLNNDELFIPTEKESIVDHNVISSAEQVKESNLNVIKPETAKNSNHYRKKINLCLTKPISVECISLENKNNVHKDVQTSFSSDKSSKCIQTEEADFKSGVFDSKIRCSPQTQNIEYIRFGEETFKGASSKLYPTRDSARNPYISSEEKNCRATQTENVCSKNRKTKRVPKEAIDEKMTEFTQVKRVPYEKMYNVSSETSSVNTMSQEKESSNENLESKEGCYKSADNTNEFQAEEMLLAEMISLNYSKNLNTDIKRSINILQKLLKSRKYDNSTKKYYIKKIVQKIVESKYSDDSTSSDLFMPKKKTVEPRPVKETKSETEKPKSSTNLMDNLPWYPISEPIYSVPKNNTKKSVSSGDKKFTDDNNLKPRKSEKKTIAPNVTNENQRFIPPVQKDKMKIPEAKVDQLKVPLISPEDIHRSNNSATTTEDLKINQKYPRPDKTAKLASKSSSKLIYNPVPQKDYRPISSEGKIGETNWRTAKTLSEKLLENRDLIDFKNGQGDYLLHVVKNERNHQLSWINNEIEHLVKLKELLEKKPEKTRPDSKLKDVISSLLKMKENDMKGLPRNFEVFICKCKAPKGKCDRHCRGPKDNRKTQKKTACLTPGYYTIETQLDPDGNLLDLTVFDGSGSKKYNYKRDGVVDDVSISSKNHNTEVKLKPKAGEYPGRILSDACKECCACGRMFVPPSNDSEMSICEVCAEDLSVRDVAMPMRNGYKICKDCGKMFIPPRENPNICICQECYDDKPVSDQRPGLQSELCEACGRLFVRREDDSELCLCKRCKKELIQVERLSCHPTPPCNVCRDCGRKFLASVQDPEQCVCNECSEFKRQEEKRCSCQKVKFSNPLEAGVCKCVTRDFPNAVNDSCCSACGRESSQCVCGPKFVPKKPKLIGSKDGEDSYARKGSPCSHCIGVQANAPGKSNLTKCSSPRDSSKDWESKYCGSECPKSRHSITFDDECSKYCPGEIRKISQLSLSCPGSTQSSTESLQSIPNRAQYQSPSQQSAKKEKQSRKKAPPSSSRIANRSKLETGEQRAYSLQAKKSCQCCTCNNCSVQTKRPGDKNARCQCCVCENCGIQVSLDENGRPRKIIRSKWCLKHTDTKTNKKNSNSKSNRTYVECEKKKRRKKDELDCTDESLQSISSGNIICITPTKYKNMNRQKSDSTCQCTAPRRRCELEQHKSLQICPSVLKAICKSVNTSAHQERICSPNCQQATPGTSDSFMRIRIPQGVQCSDIEIDYEAKPSSKSFYPQICFFSPTPPPPCPPCRQPCQPPPCPPPCIPPPCPPPCSPPYPPAPCPSTCRPPSQPCPPPCSPPPPCRPCPSFYSPPPCRPPPCPPPPCRPCPSFYSPPPCAPPPCRPCPPPPCRPCPPPCTPPPCRPCPPPCSPPPCRPCPPPCSPPPCRPCQPPPCRPCPPPCAPPPCRPCPPPCSPPPCRPCPPPCSPPPCRPCPPPCPPPPCNPCPPPCSPPPCRSCPSQCRPCPPPCRPCPPPCSPPPCQPCPSQCQLPCRPCTPPCPPPCPPPKRCCSPCPSPCPPPRCRSCGPCPPQPCRRKSCKPPSCKIFPPCTRNRPPRRSCKPFPLLPRCKTSCRTVCCAPVPCCPSECTPPPSCRPSGCGISDCPFQSEKPPSAPPGCRCKTPPPEAKETLSVLLHVPCKLCGIPPCAAISSMSCPICSKCKRKSPVDDSDSLKPKKSRSDSDHPKRNSQNRPKTKSNSPNPNSNSRETSKSICEPCDDDNSSTAPDDVSAESSPSSSSLPSRSVPPDESRSCESLDYPCKPLKPKTARVRDNSSEASLTCPSKKAVCPAKPPPCPGAGDKPCPSFPPRPCPNRRGRDREEDYKMRSSKSERRESQDSGRRRSREERKSIQENDSILLPLSIQSRSPLQELQDAKREYKRSEGSSRDLQTQDEVPSMPSTSPPKSAQPFPGNNKPNVQVYSCTTENQAYPNQDQEYSEQKKCTCGPGTCKCCQTATHEEKVIQCPAFRQCTCQTEPKEDANIQCNCKEHAGVSCNCDEVYQDKDNACKCKTSSSSSSSNSGSDSHMSCICCKKEKILKNLISKIPLCGPCQEVHRTNFYPHNYCDPNHSCICYNLVNRDLLCQFKQTLTELERLDIYQQYCEVLKNCKCCKKCGCKCKLPTKFKNGCAYFLKLEDACPNKHCEEEECDSDFFNCEEEEEEDRENYLPEVTVKVPNPRCSCGRKKKNGHEAKKYTSCPSIQNYLCTLKPDFIARAERRRRILRDATTQREENSEKRKLNFIEKVNYLNQRKRNDKVSSESNIYKQNGYQTNTYCVFDIELNDSPKRVQPRVFKSFREMKDLTRRRYLHLTEVKSKKKLNREKRLREANRLLANTFTRRLQRSTLRGNVDIPLNVKVVAY